MKMVLIGFALLVAAPLFLMGCTKPITNTPANVNSTTDDAFDDLVADPVPVDVEAANQDTTDNANEFVRPISEPSIQDEAATTEAAEVSTGEFLTIGNAAPAIAASSWVKGEPAQAFEPGQVYVVEFWATWCGPCRTSMPHISALQEEYGDAVRFIGFSRETEEVVRKFLDSAQSDERSWDETVKYTLAMDDGGATFNAYMSAAGQTGIPTAFVVGRDGMIDWIGHPMSMDEPLRQIVADTWDRPAARNIYESQEKAKRARNKATATIRQAFKDQDWDAALAAIEPLVAEFPEDAGNARLLNQIAWNIATGNEPRDLELALRAAEKANQLTQESNGAILDTLARVHYELGDLDAAITWQQKAVEAQPDSAEIKKSLDRYQTEKNPPINEDPSEDEEPELEQVDAETEKTTDAVE